MWVSDNTYHKLPSAWRPWPWRLQVNVLPFAQTELQLTDNGAMPRIRAIVPTIAVISRRQFIAASVDWRRGFQRGNTVQFKMGNNGKKGIGEE